MNKYIKYAAIATIGLALTGCGGKKLTCSYSESSSFTGEQTQQNTYVYDKDGKNLQKYTEVKSAKYTEKALKYYDKGIDDVLKQAEEDCDDYEDVDFITCNATAKGNKITQTITYNFKGLDEDDIKDMYDDKDISYSVYSKAKKLLDKSYNDLVRDSNDDDESLYKYSCK